MKKQLLVLGDLCLDWIRPTNLGVSWNELQTNSHWANQRDQIVERPGGTGLNLAIYAKDAGIKTTILGCVGDDFAGETIRNFAQSYGIGNYFVKSSKLPTNKVIIVRDRLGTRLMLSIEKNANQDLQPEHIEAAANLFAFDHTLYISGLCIADRNVPRFNATRRAIELSRRNANSQIILDVVPHDIYKTYLNLDDFFSATEGTTFLISQISTLRRLAKLGVKGEEITQEMALETISLYSKLFSNLLLRYGVTGLDYQLVYRKDRDEIITDYYPIDTSKERSGLGDKMTINAIIKYFGDII